ncbi:hypothetical protein [Pararhizobium antarcticum]|uniref:hypothetical protein n=1 Tax=Pararhizobium antarcticum TaxID=1798805 RepID=UPI0011147B3E|nr:hypothetical protein [Pararhizobium antarcticum]
MRETVGEIRLYHYGFLRSCRAKMLHGRKNILSVQWFGDNTDTWRYGRLGHAVGQKNNPASGRHQSLPCGGVIATDVDIDNHAHRCRHQFAGGLPGIEGPGAIALDTQRKSQRMQQGIVRGDRDNGLRWLQLDVPLFADEKSPSQTPIYPLPGVRRLALDQENR